MTGAPFRIIPFSPSHDRSNFNCGSDPLDRYFRERLTQDIKRKITSCFVALSSDGRMAGYYTLASASVFLGDLPHHVQKSLPRYPSVPVVRLGRLAVDQAFKGMGLGGVLLADALLRVLRSEIAAFAMVVDAKDNDAASFYAHHGFIETASQPLTLFLPLASIQNTL